MRLEHHPHCNVNYEAYAIGFDPRSIVDLTPREIVAHDNIAPQIPPRTIDELIAAMESMFEVSEPTDCSLSVTGEPYITLCCGGVKLEGERMGVYCTDEQKAIDLFYREWRRYWYYITPQGDQNYKLYWRQMPMMREHKVYEKTLIYDADDIYDVLTLYIVTARLLISDKPQISTGKDR